MRKNIHHLSNVSPSAVAAAWQFCGRNFSTDGIIQLLKIFQLGLQLSDGSLRHLQVLHVPLILLLDLDLVRLVNLAELVPMGLVLLRYLLIFTFNFSQNFLSLIRDLLLEIILRQEITEFLEHIAHAGASLIIRLLVVILTAVLIFPHVDYVPHLSVFLGRLGHVSCQVSLTQAGSVDLGCDVRYGLGGDTMICDCVSVPRPVTLSYQIATTAAAAVHCTDDAVDVMGTTPFSSVAVTARSCCVLGAGVGLTAAVAGNCA